jgi:quercetin dioxygenase-like cupin family protein
VTAPLPSIQAPPAVGDTIESPSHDLRALVLETSHDLLRAEVHAGSRGNGGPLHRHLRQEERFLVSEGTLRVREGLRGSRIVEAGGEVAIPAGKPHTFKVVSESAHFIAEFRPAWQIAEVFRDVFTLSSEGRFSRIGTPRLSDVAALIERYPEDFFYAPFVPIGLQRGLAGMLARRHGDRAR